MVAEREPSSTGGPAPNELSLLAAVRPALDGEAVAARRNVLVDTVLVVLYRDQAANTPVLAERVGKLFRTSAVPVPLVQAVLESARIAGLVTTQRTLDDRDEWVLTAAAARDVRDDHEWAADVVGAFDRDARRRLADDVDRDQFADDKIERIVSQVRDALAVGCQGAYGVEEANTPNALRPIDFNGQAALRYVREMNPKSARHAAERLLVAALNPDDDFGDEYIHLLVAGNVLHALATRRDLPDAPKLTGMRVILDTSVLVWLPAPGTPEHQRLVEAIGMARNLGVDVIVPTHVIDEWIGRFDVTDAQVGDALAKRVGPIGALSDDPFLRAFNADTNADVTWQQFRQRWHDPTDALHELGISTRYHGNTTASDQAVVERLIEAFNEANAERAVAGNGRRRNKKAIEADAHSLAMIVRWRKRSGADSGFFIAADYLSGRAYEVGTDDKIPVTMTLSAWLVLLTTLTTDDPAREVEIAKIVSHASLRDSFFALSACYGPDEIVRFAETLAADSAEPLSQDELNQFIVSQLARLEDDKANGNDPTVGGGQVLQYRNQKRNARARRAEATKEAEIERVRAEERLQRDIEVAVVEARSADKEAALASDLDAARNATRRTSERNAQLWRALVAVVISSALAAVLAAAIVRDWIDSGWTVGLILAGVVWVSMAGYWVVKGTRQAAALAVFGVVVPTIVSYMVDKPPW